MKRLLISLLAANIFLSGCAHAAFTYQSRPISPDCLTALLDLYDIENPAVELSKCSSQESAHRVQVVEGVVTTEDKSLQDTLPYANYSVIGEDGNRYLIGVGQWTGGSGFFSNIMWVQLDGGKLTQLKVVASGDRCNGGAYNAGPWQYTVNMTSADLVNFAHDKSVKIQPYTDLDASAAGCVAKAYYMFHPDTGTTRLMYVRLDDKAALTGEWEKQFVTQHCFDKLMRSYVDSSHVELGMDELKLFAAQYRKQCLKNPEI